MTEEITEAIRNAFNEYLNAVDKVILENQALQIELQHLKQENEELKDYSRRMENQRENYYKEYKRYRSALEEIRKMTKKYNAKVGDTIIANPIQDCYDIYCKINEVLG